MKKNTFYITTAIDYVNAEPHIGHAYQKIIADAISRWNKLNGKEVFFVTGTDEHGKKVAESARVAGKKSKEWVDFVSDKFKEAWKSLDIDYDRFIRTTDKDHEKTVNDFTELVNKSGDIYKGKYEGIYCIRCETYYTEKDLINGECTFHRGIKLENVKEETYFFKLSKYEKFLLELYKKHPEFILPESRRNEVINRVKEGLRDLSITRGSLDWGIPFKLDKKHVLYVWFEALISYYTATREKGREKFWPADIHLLGRDNTWFHAVIWPAMLKSAGIDLPRTVFNHGFLTFNGQKISKSLGNSISVTELVKKYGADTMRYFVCRQFPLAEGNDGDFSESSLVKRNNTELADKLGNLVSRVSALAEKYGIESTKSKTLNFDELDKIKKYLDNFELDKTLNELFSYVDRCNEYVQEKKPWESGDKKVLYELIVAIKNLSILLSPFIPSTSEKIAKHFHFKIDLKEINKAYKVQPVKKSEILFKKIEFHEELQKQNINKSSEGIVKMSELKFDDWQNVDLRVGKILEVEDLKESEKLYKLKIDLGTDHRTLVAGIKKHYTIKELKGNKFIFLANLEPRKIMGIKSEAMILAASSGDKLSLVKPDRDAEVGSRLG